MYVGKLLNVREATTKQILENKEINDLVKVGNKRARQNKYLHSHVWS